MQTKRDYLALIVEDTRDMAEIMQEVINAMGIHTYHVSDANEAMKFLTRYTPDLMLLDIGLPGKDGWTLMKEIEEHHPNVMFPVIVLSAYDDALNRTIGRLHKHIFHYITKPFKPTYLKTVVLAALELDKPEAAASGSA
jgi:two-component system, OmpR family, response regulator BaeR